MFIYNVTTKVDISVHEAWLIWMIEIHIPEVLATGCFEKYQLVRILEIDDSEGPTYAIQYTAASKSLYNRYVDVYAPKLRQSVAAKWGSRVIAFSTLMQVVN